MQNEIDETDVEARFSDLEEKGLVRIRAEPERDNYYDVYGDCGEETEEIDRRIEQDGLWVLFAEYRLHATDSWSWGDNIGMVFGGDESYHYDLKHSALKERDVEARFSDLEEKGLVRIRYEPEQDSYLDVYGECDEETANLIDREGLWVLFAEYRLHDTDQWEQADNIGMIIGDDKTYHHDLNVSALKERDELVSDEVESVASRATYAMV